MYDNGLCSLCDSFRDCSDIAADQGAQRSAVFDLGFDSLALILAMSACVTRAVIWLLYGSFEASMTPDTSNTVQSSSFLGTGMPIPSAHQITPLSHRGTQQQSWTIQDTAFTHCLSDEYHCTSCCAVSNHWGIQVRVAPFAPAPIIHCRQLPSHLMQRQSNHTCCQATATAAKDTAEAGMAEAGAGQTAQHTQHLCLGRRSSAVPDVRNWDSKPSCKQWTWE